MKRTRCLRIYDLRPVKEIGVFAPDTVGIKTLGFPRLVVHVAVYQSNWNAVGQQLKYIHNEASVMAVPSLQHQIQSKLPGEL